MTNGHETSVRDVIELLNAVKVALHDTPAIAIEDRLNDAIELLERAERSEQIDHRTIIDALRIIGDGLAMLPVIAQLIDALKR